MYNYIFDVVILNLLHQHLFAMVTICGFERISGYRPVRMSKESSARSRLQCTLSCAKDSACAGFSFMWMRGMWIGYELDTGMETVRFIPEDEAEFYIKGNV